MTKEEIYKNLQSVFEEVFDDEDIVIGAQTTANDIKGWDSLRHITLMSAVEEAFDLSFDMRDIVHLKSVGELVDLIEREL